jgi:hypothetical protein
MNAKEQQSKLKLAIQELKTEAEKAKELKLKKLQGWTALHAPGELMPGLWRTGVVICPSLGQFRSFLPQPWVFGPRARPMLDPKANISTHFGVVSPEGAHFSFVCEWPSFVDIKEDELQTWAIYSHSSDFEMLGQWLANAFNKSVRIVGDDPDVKNRYLKSYEFSSQLDENWDPK